MRFKFLPVAIAAALAGCASLDPCEQLNGDDLASCQFEQAARQAVSNERSRAFWACDARAEEFGVTGPTASTASGTGIASQLTDQCMKAAGFRRASSFASSSPYSFSYEAIDEAALRAKLGYGPDRKAAQVKSGGGV